MSIRALAAIGMLSVTVVDLHHAVAVAMIPGAVARKRRTTMGFSTGNRGEQRWRNVMFLTHRFVFVTEVVLIQHPMGIARRDGLRRCHTAMAQTFGPSRPRTSASDVDVIQDSRWVANVPMIRPV